MSAAQSRSSKLSLVNNLLAIKQDSFPGGVLDAAPSLQAHRGKLRFSQHPLKTGNKAKFGVLNGFVSQP